MRYEFTFTVRGLSDEVLERIIERVSELIPSEGLRVEVKGDKVRIVVQGPVRSAGAVRFALQRALSEVIPSGGYRSIVDLVDLATSKRLPPADLVAEALKKRGYDSDSENLQVMTDAPFQLVREVYQRLEAIWDDTSHVGKLSRAARKALTLASYLTSRPPTELIEIGIEGGVLVRSKTNKILTAGDWRTAAERIRRMIGLG
ncbi:MAG: DUF2067 family protein [Acidilobus sp.]